MTRGTAARHGETWARCGCSSAGTPAPSVTSHCSLHCSPARRGGGARTGCSRRDRTGGSTASSAPPRLPTPLAWSAPCWHAAPVRGAPGHLGSQAGACVRGREEPFPRTTLALGSAYDLWPVFAFAWGGAGAGDVAEHTSCAGSGAPRSASRVPVGKRLAPLLTRPWPSCHPAPQPSHKTFKIKRVLGKKAKQNRPLPHWMRMRTGNTIRCVSLPVIGRASHTPHIGCF